MDFRSWNFVWATLFAVIAFLAAGGNILTIIIFCEKKLRKRPHFLLVSMAVADLLVGLVAVPLYITINYLDIVSSRYLNVIYIRVDMFAGLASIFTLTVIALERMYAIGWPFCHRVLKSQAYAIAIATPWIMSFIVTIIAYFLRRRRQSSAFFIAIFLLTPVVLTCVAYFVLWKKERSRKLRHQVQETKTLKLTKTVALLTAAFVLTWLPFKVFNLVICLCISCRKIPPVVVYVIKLLQYGNSVINIVIYPFRDQEYRKSLFKMLSIFKCSCRNKLIRLSPANMGISVISVVSYSIDTQLSFDNFPENTRL